MSKRSTPRKMDGTGRRGAGPGLPLLILAVLIPSVAPASGQGVDPRMQAVEERIMLAVQARGREGEAFPILRRLEHYQVPGVSVAVLDSGRVAWAKGYGVKDVETGEAVLPETLFQAASISKPVAAMAALRLVEEGRLALDAPVNDYLVSWKIPENRFTRENPVTLRHLLTHTGGLTVHGFPGYALNRPLANTIQVLNGSGPANTDPIVVDTVPGSLWRYSGGGYTVMQQLLEDVTGTPFPELLRELVLDPAGMPISSYAQPLPPGRASYAAVAHLSDGSRGDGPWHVYPEMAAAGLWTNPTELAQLAMLVQASLNGGSGGILSPAMTRAQLTPGLGDWGLGFAIQGEGSEARFSHGGSNYGFKAQFMAFLEGGRGVFVMTNGDRGSVLAREIILAVAREYGWPAPEYEEVTLAEDPGSLLEEIVGSYRVQGTRGTLEISVEEDHLVVRIDASRTVRLHLTAESSLIDLSDGTRIRVDRDEAGKIVALQQMGGPRIERVGG